MMTRASGLEVAAPNALFVDLDGTLIATDLLWESIFLAVRTCPLDALKIPIWLLKGRPHLKQQLAGRVNPTIEQLPFRSEVLEFLKAKKDSGCKIVLATASHEVLAKKVIAHVGLFDDYLATNSTLNLKGTAKGDRIERYCREHGWEGFDYIGDAWADLPIWQRSQRVYVVNPTGSLRSALTKLGKETDVLVPRRPRVLKMIKALRPYQWVKNLLLFVPLVLAHQLSDVPRLLTLMVTFCAFSACASAVYLFNDALDLEADRLHPKKCRRPFASGQLPVFYAPAMILALLFWAFGVSLVCLPWNFSGLLLVYFVANLLYSTWLKRKLMIDVLLLAGMYTLRVLAGGVAADVPISEWLLAFSTFFFLSLAFAKRYSELRRLGHSQENSAVGRGYVVSDISLIESMGPCSGYMAVLVLALYVNSAQVSTLYPHRWPLWLVCPLLLYWVSRLWFAARRGALMEDPIVFAISDRVSLIVGALLLALATVAAWGS